MTNDINKAIELAGRAVEQLQKIEGSTMTEALIKSHVKEYSRTTASGASVQVHEHDDSRHPNIIGQASDRDNTMPAAANSIHHDGREYHATGKKGTSMHDGRPVREFESHLDGHRVWYDDKNNVHADSKEEADKHHKRGMYADHTAEDAKAEYDGKRKSADKATEAADKHQAGMKWDNPDMKKLQSLHHDAAKKHIDAMETAHKAGDGESMRHHYYKASMHLGAAGSAGTFDRKDKDSNATEQSKMAEHIGKIADQHKAEDNAHSLDHGSSIHLLAAEQHRRAQDAHSHASGAVGDKHMDKYEHHRDKSKHHGAQVVENAGKVNKANDAAYAASDKAGLSGKAKDHKAAAAAHREAAKLNYDSEGKAENEAKAAEHDKKAKA